MERVHRTRRSSRLPRRILLVGLTPLMMRVLEAPLARAADVSAVPFPGQAFERAARNLKPDLVVVDVTYLSEDRVRPVILDRFSGTDAVLVFTSESGGGWVDDTGRAQSWHLASNAPATLLSLVGPQLSIVTDDAT